MRFVFLLLLLSLLINSSCGSIDPQVSYSTDLHDFRIIQVIGDSLYGGEQLKLVGTDLGIDASQLSVFVGSREANIDSLSEDTLFFKLARYTESGKVRLYKYDSVLAEGDFRVIVDPLHVEDFMSVDVAITPARAYPGQMIVIRAERFPPVSKISMTLGGEKLGIVRLDSNMLTARIPMGAKSALLRLNVFGMAVFAQQYTILEPGGSLLAEHTLAGMSVEANELAATVKTTTSFDGGSFPSQLDTGISFVKQTRNFERVTQSGTDSLIFSVHEQKFDYLTSIDIRMKPTLGSNTVSGTIKFATEMGEPPTEIEQLSFALQDARWEKDGEDYIISIFAGQLVESLKGISYDFTKIDQGYTTVGTLMDYRGAKALDSFFKIRLSP